MSYFFPASDSLVSVSRDDRKELWVCGYHFMKVLTKTHTAIFGHWSATEVGSGWDSYFVMQVLGSDAPFSRTSSWFVPRFHLKCLRMGVLGKHGH